MSVVRVFVVNEQDAKLWRCVDQFLQGWIGWLRQTTDETRQEAVANGVASQDISNWTGGEVSTQAFGQAFRKAGIKNHSCRFRDQHRGGRRRRRTIWNTEQLVAACEFVRRQGMDKGRDSIDDQPSIALDFPPYITASYSMEELNESTPYENTPEPRLALPSDVTDIGLHRNKQIIHSFFPSNDKEIAWRDVFYFNADGAYYGYLHLVHKLIDEATLRPNGCLELDYNLNKDGYPEWQLGLFSKLSTGTGLNLAYDMPCRSIPRFMAIVAYPFLEWKVTMNIDGQGAALDREDMVAHHKCRNRRCINPLHLEPMMQQWHRDMHSFAGDDHPSIET